MTFGSYIMGTSSVSYFGILYKAEKSMRTYCLGPDFMSVTFLTLFAIFPVSAVPFPLILHPHGTEK